jgi:meso-butanediol dehydrogenase / (S,S)-butanediol dehydrogenase / diacetyl reductase
MVGVMPPGKGAVMADRFTEKSAVVTGGASGIGLAIARRAVAEGGTVVAGDVNQDGLAALQAELGDAVVTVRSDVTLEEDVAGLVESCADRFGSVDSVFNVAGASRPSLIRDMSEGDWDFTVDLCLKGVFFGVKHAARHMAAAGRGGAIVNVASLNSRVPMVFGAAYSAAKAGVVSLTQSAAIELGDLGIRINAVSPGLTATPLVDPMLAIPGAHEAFMERIPLRRPAQPDDIAAAALFLASTDAAYITGANLFVDGGWEHTAYPDLRRLMGESSPQT